VDPKRSPHGGKGAPSPLAAASAAAPANVAGRVAQAAKAGAVAEAIDRLAADIRQLRADFERFFSGAIALPPEELRRRVQGQLRQLRNVSAMSAVERFRLSDLEARHNSYDELFTRRLREREEGRRKTGAHAQVTLPREPQEPSPRYDPAAGVVIGRAPDPRAVAALYEGLSAAGLAGTPGDPGGPPVAAEGPRFDLASFGSYLVRQAAVVRDRTGCDDVQFRLVAEGGKLKLKARPLVPGSREDRGTAARS